MKKAQLKALLHKVHLYPDTVRVQKDGVIVLRWWYFLPYGRSAQGFADKLSAAEPVAVIIQRVEDHNHAWPSQLRSWYVVAFRWVEEECSESLREWSALLDASES